MVTKARQKTLRETREKEAQEKREREEQMRKERALKRECEQMKVKHDLVNSSDMRALQTQLNAQIIVCFL